LLIFIAYCRQAKLEIILGMTGLIELQHIRGITKKTNPKLEVRFFIYPGVGGNQLL